MTKINARYYYAPICTESFASLDRLKVFFSQLKDTIQFDVINIAIDKLEIDESFKTNESTFLTALRTNQVLLMYGKLFINDIEIPGFPPSKKHIEGIFNKLNIEANFDCLKAYYNNPVENKLQFDDSFFTTKEINDENCFDVCQICTKYSRYINPDNYLKTNWLKHEKEKSSHLTASIRSQELIGYLEYHNEIPIGFIEGYTSEIANKYGFVVNDSINSCMITCLHIREEAKGYGISKILIMKFIDQARKRGFDSVQVIAFQDDMNWQPIGLYKKMNFKEVKKIGKCSLMNITI